MKHLYIFLSLFIVAGSIMAQQRVITLNVPDNVSKTYIARDTVELLPGYTFEAGSGKAMEAYIDPYMLTESNYIAPELLGEGGIYDRDLNTSLAVGTTAGSADVSPTGAATYTIPITVVPGTTGIQPNISINYNSQGGNGLLGYGWSLSAYSAITRTGKTIYHDGKTDGIKLDNTDNLVLDGQRLILISGTNLQTNAEYRTESESFRRIICKSNGAKNYFEVTDKEGNIYYYGNTGNSFIGASGVNNTALFWLLTKAKDVNGNYMTYEYENDTDTGEFYLKRIDYTGNENAAGNDGEPYASVEFLYETRNDSNISFVSGTQINASIQLRKIQVSYDGQLFREYRLNYAFDRYWTKLIEVEEYNSEGKRYNSTVINWTSPDDNLAEHFSILNGHDYDKCLHYIDFNGDGIPDVFAYRKKDADDDWGPDSYAYLHLGTYGVDSNGKRVINYNSRTSTISLNGARDLQFGDFNGDGKMDLLKTVVQKDGLPKVEYNYYLSIFDGNSFSGFTKIAREGDKLYTPHSAVGDFNGDGKAELLIECGLFGYNGQQAEYIAGSTGITFEQIKGMGLTGVRKAPRRKNNTDFSGSGKDQMVASTDNGTDIYQFNGTTWNKICTLASLPKDDDNDTQLFYGDFNGDGLMDILARKKESGTPVYKTYYSKGGSSLTFFEGTPITTADINSFCDSCSTNNNENFTIRTDDLNGDGKSDLAFCFYTVYNTTLTVLPFISTGMGFEQWGEPVTFSNANDSLYHWQYRLSIVDLYGTGKPKILLKDKNTNANRFNLTDIFKNEQPNNLQVSSATNGMKQKTEFTYFPAIDPAVYTKSTSQTLSYPLLTNTPPMLLVQKLKVTDKSGAAGSDHTFSYKNIRIHVLGKGFLGFEEVNATDHLQQMKTTTRYGFNSGNFDVYLAEQHTATLTGKGISSVYTTPFYQTLSGGKRYFAGVTMKTEVDSLTLLKTVTNYHTPDYNNGNITWQTVTKGDVTTSTLYTWDVKNSIFKNRLTKSITTNSYGSKSAVSETKRFEYDNLGRLTKQVDFSGIADSVITAYSNYDVYGNAKTVTTSARNCPAVTRQIEFDTAYKGRFMTSSEDALGNKASYTYAAATGNMLTKTTADGHTVSYAYDGWGNLLTETAPGNIVTTYARAFVNDDSEPGLYTETVSVTGVEDKSQVWYDNWGREIKTQAPGFHSGDYVYTSKEYNAKGQLEKERLPFKANDTDERLIEYTYDRFGRDSTVNDRGRTTRYAYSGLKTTTTRPDNTTSSVRINASGLVASAIDASGDSVAYAYNSFGKPDTISSNGLKTILGYDSRGNRTSLKDPNLVNPITYEYNAYGQQVKETNARNQVTTYQYDILGRMVKESRPEGVFDYEYGESGTQKNRLKVIKKDSVTVQQYTYDTWGNRLTDTETFEGIDYTNSYTYDGLLRLKTRTTPSGLRLSYGYNQNGHLYEIRNGETGALFWRLDHTNAAGQPVSGTLGNGLVREAAYNRYDHLTSLRLMDGTTPKDNMAFAFDSITGNLFERNDSIHCRYETFRYDRLNRLTSTRRDGTNTDSLVYQANGNIVNRLNVGTYNYGNNNHAVSDITDLAAGYNPPSPFTMAYNSANHIDSLAQETGAAMKALKFTYGYDGKRRKMAQFQNNTLAKTRYYIGSYEKDSVAGSVSKEIDYIYLPDGEVVVLEKTGASRTTRFVHTDHLGSFRTVTAQNKVILAQYTYDPWGIRTLRSGMDLGLRGFTGHEHLDDFGLINMNARLYDPVLGRFLGVDPYVQLPDYTQNFNRYAYAMNNPLCYIDPEGESLILALFIAGGALLGAYTGASIQSKSFNPKKWEKDWWKGALIGGVIGAATGGTIGAMWEAGAPITLGVQLGNLTVPAITFTPATAMAGGVTTVSVGAGIFGTSGLVYALGNKSDKDQNKKNILENSGFLTEEGLSGGGGKGGGGKGGSSGSNWGENVSTSAYTLRGNDVNWNVLFSEFQTGTGPERSLFRNDHPMVEDLKNSLIVNMARTQFLLQNNEPLKYWDAPFGASGAAFSSSLTEQFIGGARVTIIPSGGGYYYQVDDTKDKHSFYYHFNVTNPNRTPGQTTPYGTTYQRYIWFERNLK